MTSDTNRRVHIVENWIESVSMAPYTNQNRPNIIFTAENYDVVIERNVVAAAGTTLESSLLFDITALPPAVNLTMRGNVSPLGRYGVFASGIPRADMAWTAGATGVSVWENMAFIGTGTNYPPRTTFHPTLADALTMAGFDRAIVDASVAGVDVSP
jgi:hypothetical protein